MGISVTEVTVAEITHDLVCAFIEVSAVYRFCYKPNLAVFKILNVGLACSRRSDSRAREKNSRRKKKRGETRGGKHTFLSHCRVFVHAYLLSPAYGCCCCYSKSLELVFTMTTTGATMMIVEIDSARAQLSPRVGRIAITSWPRRTRFKQIFCSSCTKRFLIQEMLDCIVYRGSQWG